MLFAGIDSVFVANWLGEIDAITTVENILSENSIEKYYKKFIIYFCLFYIFLSLIFKHFVRNAFIFIYLIFQLYKFGNILVYY